MHEEIKLAGQAHAPSVLTHGKRIPGKLDRRLGQEKLLEI
jgi:hypothetical protein